MKRRGNSAFIVSLMTIAALLISWAPAAAGPTPYADPIVIDGIKEAAWGDALAVDPLADISEPNLDLNGLYMVEDAGNYYIGFDAFASSWGMTYGIYIDTDGLDGLGASSDPWGRAVKALSAHLPEHTLYVYHDPDTLQDAQLNHWDGSGWSWDSLISQGGEQAYGPENDWIEYKVPKTALGSPDRIYLELFTTGGNGHAQDSCPSDPNVAFADPEWTASTITTLSAFAAFPPLPAPSWYVRGDFNGWGTGDPMYDDGSNGDVISGDGIYTALVTPETAGWYAFKVGTSDWSSGFPGSGNSWLVTGSNQETVTITFDVNNYEDGWLPATNIIGVSSNPDTWTAVGNWQGWDNAKPETSMIADGSGLYTLTTQIAMPGSYEFKAVNTGTWDSIGSDGRSVNAASADFSTEEADQEVKFTVDPAAGRVQVAVTAPPPVPQPDNNIWWDGLGHDSRSDLYRAPFGAVTTGTPVILRFRSYHNDLTSVTLRVWSTTAGAQTLYPMQRAATTDDPPYGYDYWQALIPAQEQPTVLYYRFIVRDGSDEDYYEDDDLFDGSWGQAYEDSPDYSFQIDVYDPAFITPDWMKNAVIYQIFPDRFFSGEQGNNPKPEIDPDVYGETVVAKNWSDLPEGYCQSYAGATCEEEPMGRDFFGGDLKGVTRKLDYLKSLGVTTIYFNPIFQGPSNHMYDTTDYFSIDPYLGSKQEFDLLVKQAKAAGINIILDGVFNHTSSDSLYFDKYARYDTLGAFESHDSLYYDWYTFSNWPEEYNAWWGFDSLPVLTEIQSVRDFIYGNNNSVARYWIKQGTMGWRLDVAPDKSHEYWQEFRPQVKSANPNAVIVGEIWDDASEWLLGNEFDSTMNYRFRRALLGFVNGEMSDPNQGTIRGLNPSEFDSVMQSIKEDYPTPAFQAMMNLVGTHDTQRILWALTPGERNREDKEFNAANLAEGKAKLELLAIVQMTMPGAPTIYYGDEAGLTGDTDPDDRRPFAWDAIDQDLLGHYSALIRIRNQHSYLRTGSYDTLFTNNDDGTYAFGRKDLSGAAVIAVNRDANAHSMRINVSGYIPEGATLTDALNGGSFTVSGGMLDVSVDGRWGRILITAKKADLKPPEFPNNLEAAAGAGVVDLQWNAVRGAAGYNVYRSIVTHGGYQKVNDAPVSGTTYHEKDLLNGRWYYYVVTAVDAAGNESARSNEADAMPALVIGWANLQWPTKITHTISAVTPTETIYGQVWIEGETSQPGETPGLTAQLGYGPHGSQPDGNPEWIWVDASFNADAGNNDEFKAALLPETVGTFDYAYRYSTTAGMMWLYADLDGTGNGYDPGQAGELVVNPSGDDTPPAAPGNLHVTEASTSFISLAWDASADGDVYRYEVLRSETAGGPYTAVGSVPAPGTEFTDWDVAAGRTYAYVVRAADTSFNVSGDSNEVEATAQARMVQVTLNVTIPDVTPAGSTVYIAGSFQGWDPTATQMSPLDASHWTITLELAEGAKLEYKYTLGSWETVEKDPACGEIPNRTLTVYYGPGGTMTQADTVANWRNTGTCPN